MKKFLRRISAILLGALGIFIVFNLAYYRLTKDSRIVAFEVYEALDEAEKNEGYTKLVLGDSVARQIFPPNQQSQHDDICFLATNQAIMPVGNYILLEQFIENNPQLKEVYYVARPNSLMSNISFQFTYSYFVTPMYEEPYVSYLDTEARECFEYMFGKTFIEKDYIKWLFGKYPKLLDIYHNNRQAILQMPWKKTDSYFYKENMPFIYIQHMKDACDAHQIAFHILSPPLPESFSFDFRQLQENLSLIGGNEMFYEYENSLLYLDDQEFKDGIHMNNRILDEIREEVQAKLLGDTQS